MLIKLSVFFSSLRKLLLKIICISVTVLIEIVSLVTCIKAKLIEAKADFWFRLEASYTSLKLFHLFFLLQETSRRQY